MTYYTARTIEASFDESVRRVVAALNDAGFGILTDIDVQKTMKDKLGADMPRYRILGACNPPLAHRALQAEDKIGTMLPCNVIVQQREGGMVEVAAVDPAASMQAVANPDLAGVASTVQEKLKAVIAAV